MIARRIPSVHTIPAISGLSRVCYVVVLNADFMACTGRSDSQLSSDSSCASFGEEVCRASRRDRSGSIERQKRKKRKKRGESERNKKERKKAEEERKEERVRKREKRVKKKKKKQKRERREKKAKVSFDAPSTG